MLLKFILLFLFASSQAENLQKVISRPGFCTREIVGNFGKGDEATSKEVWLRKIGEKLGIFSRGKVRVLCDGNELDAITFDAQCLGVRSTATLDSTLPLWKSCEILQRKYLKKRERDLKKRKKRELFMIPGTHWCGRGNRASKYTSLGGFRAADLCCRQHDTTCPFYIPALESRYGAFNWGISTVMHCACDERFRTCLKMALTSSANFIGKIFFNMMQTKCFVLKPQKVCVKWSWSKCESYQIKKQAFFRNNLIY